MGEDGFLTIEEATNRDAAGNLIPDIIEVEYFPGKPKIKYLPLTQGDFNLINVEQKKNKSADERVQEVKDIIKKHVLLPKLSDEDIDKMSVAKRDALVIAVFSGSSGQSQEKVKKSIEDAMSKLSSMMEAVEKKNVK